MEWVKEFESGHEQLDLEHRVMFDLINQFQEKVKQGVPLENLELVLKKIRQFAEHHFEWEEKIMAEIGFPDAETHQALHKMLLASLKDMIQEISFGSLPSESMLQYLVNWFTMHTSHEDQEMVAYLGVQEASGMLPPGAAALVGKNRAEGKLAH